jgi:mRNA-degrading endonuclease RelE of RelBE toxin-antitoxin system
MYKVKMHRRARIALDSLTKEQMNNLTETLNHLAASDIEDESTGSIQRMDTEEPLYFVKVDSELRIIIQINSPDEIEVMDIFTQERLKLFSKAKK